MLVHYKSMCQRQSHKQLPAGILFAIYTSSLSIDMILKAHWPEAQVPCFLHVFTVETGYELLTIAQKSKRSRRRKRKDAYLGRFTSSEPRHSSAVDNTVHFCRLWPLHRKKKTWHITAPQLSRRAREASLFARSIYERTVSVVLHR